MSVQASQIASREAEPTVVKRRGMKETFCKFSGGTSDSVWNEPTLQYFCIIRLILLYVLFSIMKNGPWVAVSSGFITGRPLSINLPRKSSFFSAFIPIPFSLVPTPCHNAASLAVQWIKFLVWSAFCLH